MKYSTIDVNVPFQKKKLIKARVVSKDPVVSIAQKSSFPTKKSTPTKLCSRSTSVSDSI